MYLPVLFSFTLHIEIRVFITFSIMYPCKSSVRNPEFDFASGLKLFLRFKYLFILLNFKY